ncbi:YfiT family bacillithiol transferase [Agriterribacter sp.]|uniref:YfiT family bacillithiol transferase n=1 Tax=Agriterribacter sp. TaxID=2821509 RepID=UPI002BE092B5|nr:putative metal-dependent hydrolase [Agriterribacter sp.]HRO46124.1 putative metal-dependent hydrolase [Agriterribacter sp.]HRQ16185.1 putative metal-dependent hydrolase [Agriterribacter sp.]
MAADKRYPIGQYIPKPFSEQRKEARIADIGRLPQLLENALLNLDEQQLQTPYREGGWTVQQLVHHVADSHINAYCRFKLGATESNPQIKPYDEKLWAELPDVQHLPVNISITLLHALHARWHYLLEKFTIRDWERTVFHPEQKRTITLWEMLGSYAWHGKHHTAHITTLREEKHW